VHNHHSGELMKRLIFCFDGTWQNLSQRFQTNVAQTASAILPSSSDGIQQIIYYSEGIGNARGVWPALASKFGGAFGSGLEDDLRHAYHFLSFNFEEGDEIFVFGFSRGAFTARSFCGLLNHCGILKRDALDQEDFMITEYETKSQNPLAMQNIKKHNCHYKGQQSPIKYIGVWDTVCARGLPEVFKISKPYNKKYAFHDISLNENIEYARHALALDEIRNTFPPEPWNQAVIDRHKIRYQQLWFSGDHGNVGGGGSNFLLSNITLIWIWEKAKNLGLAFDPTEFQSKARRTAVQGSLQAREITYPTSFLKGLPNSIGGFSARTGVYSEGDLHHTVIARMESKNGYVPQAYQFYKGTK